MHTHGGNAKGNAADVAHSLLTATYTRLNNSGVANGEEMRNVQKEREYQSTRGMHFPSEKRKKYDDKKLVSNLKKCQISQSEF